MKDVRVFLLIVLTCLACSPGNGESAEQSSPAADVSDSLSDRGALPDGTRQADPTAPPGTDVTDATPRTADGTDSDTLAELPADGVGETLGDLPADLPGENIEDLAAEMAEDVGAGPPACCDEATPCPDGLKCLGLNAFAPGSCLPYPAAGQCWEKDDCMAGQNCLGGVVCPCEVECAMGTSTLGTCGADPVPVGKCCANDTECGGGLCVGVFGGQFGQCAVAPTPNGCYDLWDCPDPDAMLCEGAMACNCGQGCNVTAGSCVDGGWNACCVSDLECDTGHCAFFGQDFTGACVEEPPAGQCWHDQDCAKGQFCLGEQLCPCGMLCGVPDKLGTCKPLPKDCCNTATDCGGGMVCLGENGEIPGRCLADSEGAACTEGDCCWGKDTCPPDPPFPDFGDWCHYCIGASFCPCVEACPDCGYQCPDNKMGSCEVNGCI